jgi:hypothetical protein
MVAKGWSAKQIRAYRLADNQLALNAAWDVKLLAAELGELTDMQDLIGLSEEDLAALFKLPEQPPEEFPESDETIETEHECPRCHFRWSGRNEATGEEGE